MYCYYRSLLTPAQVVCYDTLVSAMKKREPFAAVSTIHESFLSDCYTLIQWDHPELFFVSFTATLQVSANSIRVTLNYLYTPQEISQLTAKLTQVARRITQPLLHLPELEREKAIYDYLVTHVTYDHSLSKPPSSNHVVGPLLLGKAACGGYSKAFALLALYANLRVITVIGILNVGSVRNYHAWNMVYIDGIPYILDVTSAPHYGSFISRCYFNLDDRRAQRFLTPDDSLKLPACGKSRCGIRVIRSIPDLIAALRSWCAQHPRTDVEFALTWKIAGFSELAHSMLPLLTSRDMQWYNQIKSGVYIDLMDILIILLN